MARFVAATSSANEVSGICAATACSSFASSKGMTFDQLEALTKAPCTSTMFVTPGTSLSWAAAGNFAETSALAGVVWPWLGTADQVNRTRVQAVIMDLIAVFICDQE